MVPTMVPSEFHILEAVDRVALLGDGTHIVQCTGSLIVKGRRLVHVPSPDGPDNQAADVWDRSLDDDGCAIFWTVPCIELGCSTQGGGITLLRFEHSDFPARERLAMMLGLPPPSELSNDVDEGGLFAAAVAEEAAMSIQIGGQAAARCIKSGAAVITDGLVCALSEIRTHVQPDEREAFVAPEVIQVVNTTRTVANAALRFTGMVGSGVAAVAGAIGTAAAQHLATNQPDTPTVAALKVIGGASISAICTIGQELEHSAVEIGKTSGAVVEAAVRHKWGDEAGQCSHAACTAGDCH